MFVYTLTSVFCIETGYSGSNHKYLEVTEKSFICQALNPTEAIRCSLKRYYRLTNNMETNFFLITSKSISNLATSTKRAKVKSLTDFNCPPQANRTVEIKSMPAIRLIL